MVSTLESAKHLERVISTLESAKHLERVISTLENAVIVYREESLECSEHGRATVTGAG